jgi:peptide/nickel transport system substrate-binding protein
MHHMRNFLTFIKEFHFPKRKELIAAIASFSKKEFKIFILSIAVASMAMVILVGRVNSAFMTEVPASGGTITEGIIGTPTLVNPVLALSDADKDLTSIVYSGLMRKTPEGTFIPDLAESYTVSEDGMIYTFILKKNAKFQNGIAVTADDIIFTIDKIKDPLIKSPRKIGWDGVSVSKTNDTTVIFTLKQPYISFLDNTTTGILPMHIWKNVSAAEFGLSALNIKAIGSGPYQIESVSKNDEGVPEKYSLKRFSDFTLGQPHIKYINIVSYSNEKDLIKALISKSIDQASGLSPENDSQIKDAGYTIHTARLPRIFGVFLNSTNNKLLSDASIINAFDKALDRQELVDKILGGYGTIAHNPIPDSIVTNQQLDQYKNASLEEAKNILDKAGWLMGPDGIRSKSATTTVTKTKKVGKKTVTETVKVNNGPATRLAFSITTGDTPELKEATILIKEQLEKLGAQIDIKIYEPGPLNQIIRARNYEALFFGQIINHESDLFSFWHSSQKLDPGLNIAMYNNKNADAILEFAQKTLDRESRITKYDDFIKEFDKNIPAFIIYSPKYLYATLPKTNNLKLNILTTPSDRFLSIYDWYAQTDHVWKIFTNLPAIRTDK